MSDESDRSAEDESFEAELRRLVPSRLKDDFIGELSRDQQRIEDSPQLPTRLSRWLITTLVTCVVVFCGSTFLRIRDSYASKVISEVSESKNNSDNFVPISSGGYLINTSSGGIVNSDNGPEERLELRYEDVEYWHNPSTETSIRIFSPRREIVTIPLRTD